MADIDGLSARTMFAIRRIERTRTFLEPGQTVTAARLWKEHVSLPKRELWRDWEWGDELRWYCCGNPFHARDLLEHMVNALPARSAAELRRLVKQLDALAGPQDVPRRVPPAQPPWHV
ncbi:hypothetical protein ACIQU6_09685 [Streptomyces sp. NPDC090442]|uniref:hypothetical protein n=1 Tax=Streptomyces sp. NPDC090442 TaxID=3365962 RepID=UPI003812EACA